MLTYQCRTCHEVKPLVSGYYRKVRSVTGYCSACKECTKRAQRKPRTCHGCGVIYFHIGNSGTRQRVCDPCSKVGRVCALCQEFKKLDRFHGEASRYCRDGCIAGMNRRRLYGIEIGEFERMRVAQGDKCAACNCTFSGTPHLDHDHVTGEVRALLCDRCNRGLGVFGDDADALMAAAAYLLSFQSVLRNISAGR